MRTSFYHIDSAHGSGAPSTNPTNGYKFTFPSTLRGVRRLDIPYIEFGNGVYNVDSTNFFTFQIDGVHTFTATLDSGFYTSGEAITALNSKIAALQVGAVTTTVSLNDNTGTLTIKDTAGPITQLSGSSVWGLSPFVTTDVVVANTPYSASWTSTNLVNFDTKHVVFLHIDELHQIKQNVHTAANHEYNPGIIGRYQIEGTPFQTNYHKDEYKINFAEIHGNQQVNLNQLTIRWKDSEGKDLELHGARNSLYVKILCDQM